MKLMKPADLRDEAKYLRLMVYGAPGAGKTWFMASASLDIATRPVLFVEFRSQIQSVYANPKFVEALDVGNMHIVRISKYEELNHVYSWMRDPSACEQLADLFSETGGRARTICLDSVTELQRAEVMRRAGNPQDKFTRDLEYPKIRDWGNILNQFATLARMFYDAAIPMHVIFGALEQTDYNEKGDQVMGYKVALQGQSGDIVPSYALTLMRLSKAPPNADVYNVGTTVSFKAASKEQTGRFPKQISGPTVPMLVRMLEGGGKKE